MTITTLGAVNTGTKKPPKIYGTFRICAYNSDCQTIVSQYNKSDFCWQHSPKSSFRIRGRGPVERVDKESNIVNHCKKCLLRGGLRTKILVNGIVHIRGENGGANCEE